MKLKVVLFALYRERVGSSQVDLELSDRATVADLVEEITSRYPRLSPSPQRIVVAVNQEYVDHAHRLREGDEVALIPPVSGGCHGRDR